MSKPDFHLYLNELMPLVNMREQELLMKIEESAAALVLAPATHEARKPHQQQLAKAGRSYDCLTQLLDIIEQLKDEAEKIPWQGNLQQAATQCRHLPVKELLNQLLQKLEQLNL